MISEIDERILAERYIVWEPRSPIKPFDYEAQARVRVPIVSRWDAIRRCYERVNSDPARLHDIHRKGLGCAKDYWDCPRVVWQCGR